MGRTRKTQNASLGKSLIKKNKAGWDASKKEDHHHGYGDSSSEGQTQALKSVTEESSYEEFIATAALAQKDFTAEKLNIKFVSLSTADTTTTDDDFGNYLTEEEKKLVSVPRRPKWTADMSADELNELENEAFLNWRRHMAQLQEKDGITPFERNIEVWRQLWRVVERADIVVQIVDARNPLLYRCEDLENYVKELGKIPVLLINKADFLTSKQRKLWSEYFKSINLPHAFYSAEAAKASIGKEAIKEEEGESPESHEEDSDDDDEEEDEDTETDEESEESGHDDTENPQASTKDTHSHESKSDEAEVGILNRNQLIEYLKSFKKQRANDEGEFNIGLVGYPNVGKSSTINSIMASKKTSVSSTPGKTKHFQTLYLEDDVILCDCPGLVMPAFGGSKGEMVLGGILPIDQLTEYTQSMTLLAKRIPRAVLQFKYGITLPEKFDHDDLMSSYAAIRGFMTVRGLPDNSRAARIILKDYVNGKLLYNHCPPNVSQEQFQPSGTTEHLIRNFISGDTKKEFHASTSEGKDSTTKVSVNSNTAQERKLDRQFFTPNIPNVHIKGRQHVASGLSSVASSSTGLSDKPWRKHNNRNKKEKLRRVYQYLDVE